MPAHAVRKRCRDCNKVAAANRDQLWCDRCGGELVPVKYGSRKRGRKRAG